MSLRVTVLAVCMLLTGTINTISTKYQDMTVVGRLADGTPLTFRHPAVQSACMFAGEMLCLIPYFFLRHQRRKALAAAGQPLSALPPEEQRSRNLKRFLAFAIPAMCDACATTLMNVGLYFTYASAFQMLRGTLVLWAGVFTMAILRRSLYAHHWMGMVLITAGAALVGAASVMHPGIPAGGDSGEPGEPGSGGPPSAPAPLLGDCLVVAAQLFTALQFILEEKFLAKYKVPSLLAVGLEGCWGVMLCIFALPALSAARAADGAPLDDAPGAVREVLADRGLQVAIGVGTVSIAFFNFFGISVTRALSGASRATIDACRTLFIWLVALGLGWEAFQPLQVLGFAVLIAGSSLYNEMLRSCLPSGRAAVESAAAREARQPLLRSGTSGNVDGDASGSGSSSGSDDEEGGQGARPSSRAAAGSSQQQASPAQQQASGSSSGRASHSASVPIGGTGGRPAPACGRGRSRIGAMAAADSGGDLYTMARSMRLGFKALSPHSLDHDGSEDIGSYGGVGSYAPSYGGPPAPHMRIGDMGPAGGAIPDEEAP